MKVGIPSEIFPSELRVAATPKTIKRLQKQGFEVYIQRGAGLKANYSDQEFEEAGAKLVNTAAEIYGNSDIVLKVKEPAAEEIN
ncbi:MAG TPA: NAD(P)(+) transhydrogenase (Re/Si-specific) subunit alpha, partial [Bacteroidia bacterium]|nr:NAD(P)(+) transhydrogenase (Re/Si-specific) subunit alpha [Bacteroidia bacterium]